MNSLHASLRYPLPVVVLLADGARPDTLASAINRGDLPALAQLREEGGAFTVTTCFPSVTGPAYAPFLMGRFPGPIGLPGLRWFDRSRTTCRFPDYTRSYVGHQMRALDRDLAPDAPTIFELSETRLGALSVIARGLPKGDRLGSLSLRSALRAAATHFRGNVGGWLDIDREIARDVIHRVRRDRPEFVFSALTGIDKTSHSEGHASPRVLEAMRIVDDTVAELRRDAERGGYWRDLHLWIGSDHGHSPVRRHEDLAAFVASRGHRVIAHPWVFAIAPDVAVMVSGNAMSHLYLELRRRTRPFWPEIRGRWEPLASALLERESVDLMLLAHSPERTEVRTRDRGSAFVEMRGTRYAYRPIDGDPLGIGGGAEQLRADEAYELTIGTDYPDSLVQIARLMASPRSSEMVLSASRDWDFRARFEPIPHVSSHGALHREHMLVPLLLDRPPRRTPRRTADVMPSALAALGYELPPGLDGESFVRHAAAVQRSA